MSKKHSVALAVFAASVCTTAAHGQEIYAKAGLLGVGVGYAHALNDRFGLRADLSTIGTIDRERTSDQLRYDARLKAHQAGAYADWFPFANGFRLSAGLQLRQLSLEGHGLADSSGNITINDTSVPYGPGDDVSAKVKFPSVAPYVGLGWGHNPSERGWGFVFDAGVAIGKPKTTVSVSDALYARLDAAARLNGSTADAEIAAQRDDIANDADDFKLFPQLYLGVSYRF